MVVSISLGTFGDPNVDPNAVEPLLCGPSGRDTFFFRNSQIWSRKQVGIVGTLGFRRCVSFEDGGRASIALAPKR